LQNGKKNRKKAIEFEESSGNVFADLGLTDADELYARAQIGFGVYKILKEKGLKQREIAVAWGSPAGGLSSDEWPFQPVHD
jgi:predicted XRE-type DNA-binding protein